MMRTSTFDRLAAADRFDRAFLERAQQLDLRGQRQLADLVQEQRAAMGLDELAGVPFGGAGEGALLVTEQDRLDQIVGDRTAIDRDERLCLALAAAMDGACEHLLADAGLALDQHWDRRARGLLRGAHHGRHRLGAGDDVGESQPALAAVTDALQLALERGGVERVAQRDLEPLQADRLDDEIGRARAHRRDHVVDAAMGGLHDDGDAEAGLADFRQHAHAVEAGHHEIEDDGVDRRCIGGGEGGDRGVAGVHDDRLIAAFLHHVLDQPAGYCVVVGDQNTGSHGVPRTLLLSVSNRVTLAEAD